jgi:serine/threonine protein kinase
MDPIIFNMRETTDKQNLSYELTKKSDIYSLGVLFWELTSGLSPFNFENGTYSDYALIKDILEGKRENPVPNTNAKFIKLYQSKYNIYIYGIHLSKKIINYMIILIYLLK